MELPDGATLMHGTRPYDPKKAHDYYIRTRQLKGRKKGHVDPVVADLAMRLHGKSDKEIEAEIPKAKNPREARLIRTMLSNRQKNQGKKNAGPHISPQEKAQRHAAAVKRVASIKSEIADLNKKLKDALAKERKATAKEKRGPTKADRHKQARESKKYRDKHKQKLATKRKTAASKDKASGKTRADSVSSLKRQLSVAKGRLAKAIEREKALS